jgi:predicted RNA-binding protein with PIN domain
MPYLVDGNNLMHALLPRNASFEHSRRELLKILARFAAAKKSKVKLVFDGVEDDELPEGIKYKGVKVLYARPGSDADSRIKDIVRRASYKRDLTLVTSDRELSQYAKSKGAKVIASQKFSTLVCQSIHSADKFGDKKGLSEVDVQEWLAYFNKNDINKDPR